MALFTRKQIDLTIEKNILIGMICSSEFLRDVLPIYQPGLFSLKWADKIAQWCLEYFTKTEKAPYKDIDKFFIDNNNMPDNLEELISEFLLELSEKWEQSESINHKYLIAETEKFFRKRKIENFSKQITYLAENNQLDEAEKKIGEFKQIRSVELSSLDLLSDCETIQKAFNEDEKDILIKFPDKLGEMLNPYLVREGFISIMAPEKRGKTWWLMEFAFRALKCRKNVAFFQAGDMGQKDFIMRFSSRLLKKPLLKKHLGDFLIPCQDCKLNQTDECRLPERKSPCGLSFKTSILKELEIKKLDDIVNGNLDYVPCVACERCVPTFWYRKMTCNDIVEWRGVYKKIQRLSKWVKGAKFKISTHPNSSVSVKNIETILDNWEIYEGFVPDVIIIDYADILASDYNGEFRHQENDKWKALRRLSQKKKCLLITATQTDADAYKKKRITIENFSEDKRKYAHVTGMLALNQTQIEKEAGLMRINWILLREGEFNPEDDVYVAQSLRVGQPMLFSF